MERFEIWFGSIFVVMGLIGLSIAGLLYVAYGRGPRRRPDHWTLLAAPLVMGAIFTVLGGAYAGYGLWHARMEQHVLANGTTVRAYVRGPESTLVRVNGSYLWRIRYQYQDHAGRVQEGSTGLMAPDEAQLWETADVAFIRYDPDRPSNSAWLGIREEPGK